MADRSDLPGGSTEGLMAFWSDIALARQPAYQRWHNNEHIPERLSIPGFVRGRRYRSVMNELRFLMYYDTTSLRVLTSTAYLDRLNAPTPRTRDALRWFERPTRTAYTLLAAHGPVERRAPPVIAVASFAPPAAGAGATRAAALERLAAATAAERVLEYRLDDAGSTISTGEAAVHGAAPSAMGGLLVLHSRNLALLDDAAAWSALHDAIGQWAAQSAIQAAPTPEVYSLEFALQHDNDMPAKGHS